ncbi:TPA: hypothetical protein N0F65_007628, partial [Lagenidium giganteum]
DNTSALDSASMDAAYNGCNYKARREFLSEPFEVRLFDADDAGIAVVVFQAGGNEGAPRMKFSRIFTRKELTNAGISHTLEGYVTLVDSLELIEDAYFTGQDAVHTGLTELAAYQLSSSLAGMNYPEPIVSHEAATAYLTRAPVGLSSWNPKSNGTQREKLLLDVVAKGLTELCRQKPAGLNAVRWLGKWFLENNPTQPITKRCIQYTCMKIDCTFACIVACEATRRLVKPDITSDRASSDSDRHEAMADELQSSEELAFVAEEVDRIILSSIDTCLKDEVYDELKVTHWVDTICESIMKGLSEVRKPLKYIVTCMIMQKNGAGVHSSISCHWDTVTDATAFRNPFDEDEHKEAFPDFETSMRVTHHEPDTSTHSLNWSIDTIAELKPLAFSPLPEQVALEASQHTHPAASDPATFFSDPTKFRVLQTPSPHTRTKMTSSAGRSTPVTAEPGTGSGRQPVGSADLHRRCQEAIRICEQRLRERQLKMARLQVSTPTRTPQRRKLPKHSGLALVPTLRAQTPQSTPTQQAGQRESTTPFRTGVSPIAKSPSQPTQMETPTTKLTFTPTPGASQPGEPIADANTSVISSIAAADSATPEAISFGSLTLSPSPVATPEQSEENPRPSRNASADDSAASVSLQTMSLLQNSTEEDGDDSLATSAVHSTTTGIARRQESFVAAIEAASTCSAAASPVRTRQQTTSTPKTPTAIAEALHEAKALGLTEPSLQWEYAHILQRGRGMP